MAARTIDNDDALPPRGSPITLTPADESPPTTKKVPRPHLRVQMLHLAAAPTPLLFRRDLDLERYGPSIDVPDVLRLASTARRTRQGPLVIEIEGPGDPLASAADTLRALALLHDHHPDVRVGLVVDGPLVGEYTSELVALGVAYLVIRLDCASELSAYKLLEGARFRGEDLDREHAAALYVEASHRALGLAHAAGMPVAVRTTVHPLINVNEIGVLAAIAATSGVERMDLIQPNPRLAMDTFRTVMPTTQEMNEAQAAVHAHFGRPAENELSSVEGMLRAWLHPSRFEAIEHDQLKDDDLQALFADPKGDGLGKHLPRRKTQFIAVASRDGILIDTTLERADVFHIYSTSPQRIRYVGGRRRRSDLQRHRDGVGDAQAFLQSLMGCRAVVATGFSDRALTLLRAVGIHAVTHPGGRIDEILDRVARGTLP